ncbi:MAG TPA: hypothetical protein VG675_04100 [Bryobacteraceae bacterium]|nr:hypothetical protein [Bryobacteraceae bacterium]
MRLLPQQSLLVLSLLPFTAFAQTASLNLVVEPSTVPGVVTSGFGSQANQPDVDAIVGSITNQQIRDWLPFGITLSNNTSQPIVAVAARWQVTDATGKRSGQIMMSNGTIFDKPSALMVSPGKSAVALPFLILQTPQPSTRSGVQLSASTNQKLLLFQTAQHIQVYLDGVLFASGQFIGPDTLKEYESFQADNAGQYNVASAILAKHNGGAGTSDIVAWLQQTANPPRGPIAGLGNSLFPRDMTARSTAQNAQRFLRLYKVRGESTLYATAQQVAQNHVTVYR